MDEMVPLEIPVTNLNNITGQLDHRSRRIYEHDALVFARWMKEQKLVPQQLLFDDLVRYRQHLQDTYRPATAKRMWSVTRRLAHELVRNGTLIKDPTDDIKGFKAHDETPHVALTLAEVTQLLSGIDRTTKKGARDYAMLYLLARTGIRRTECAELTLGDIYINQGHHVLEIRRGKGNQRRTVKLPVEVYRAIEEYLTETERLSCLPTVPLFVNFRRGDHPTQQAISDHHIWRIVKDYAERAGLSKKFSTHGLRATFITLLLEANVPLIKVQYAAGHKQPQTTEHYQKRKLDLDDNAVDYLHF